MLGSAEWNMSSAMEGECLESCLRAMCIVVDHGMDISHRDTIS